MKSKNIVHEKDSLFAVLSKEVTLYSGRLSDQDKTCFFAELGDLLSSGKDLKDGMELITLPDSNCKFTYLISRIQSRIRTGQSLAKAIKGSGKFSEYDFYSIQIGEKTETLAAVLKDLAMYYRDKLYYRRKIRSALVYPVMFTITCFGMLLIVLLKLTDKNYLPGLFLVPAMMMMVYANRSSNLVRSLLASLVLWIPEVGELVKKIYLTRFCNMMKLMVGAEFPLVRALSISGKLIGFYPLESSLQKIETDFAKGRALHECMNEFNIYPSPLVELIRDGEEQNTLGYSFACISDQYTEEISSQTPSLNRFFEPMRVVFLGLVAGFIVAAMANNYGGMELWYYGQSTTQYRFLSEK